MGARSWIQFGLVLGSGFGSGAEGFQGLGLAGALGLTPKSQTYRFRPSLAGLASSVIISTRAYSPGVRLSVGVSFSQPPLMPVMVVLMRCCSWLILPVTWRFTSPTMRLPFLTSVRTMRKRLKGTEGCCGGWAC